MLMVHVTSLSMKSWTAHGAYPSLANSLLQPTTGAWTQPYLNDTLGRRTNIASPVGIVGTMLYRSKFVPILLQAGAKRETYEN